MEGARGRSPKIHRIRLETAQQIETRARALTAPWDCALRALLALFSYFRALFAPQLKHRIQRVSADTRLERNDKDTSKNDAANAVRCAVSVCAFVQRSLPLPQAATPATSHARIPFSFELGRS